MKEWQNLDKIFIGNAKGMETNNYGYVTKEWILENNPLYLERSIMKPIGMMAEMNSLIFKEVIRYYRDGRIERKLEYTACPQRVEGGSILSPIGYKMVDFAQNHGGGKIFNENCSDNLCNE